VSLLDLLPTLTDLAGIKTDIPLDGRSLLPMLRGETVPEAEVFSEYCCDTADPWSTSTCIAAR
jgi:arylsulfatase A-like enzyme